MASATDKSTLERALGQMQLQSETSLPMILGLIQHGSAAMLQQKAQLRLAAADHLLSAVAAAAGRHGVAAV